MIYYVYAPSYDENSGGCVVLHRLCHLLNSIDGCSAYLVPRIPEKLSINSFSEFREDFKNILVWLCKLQFLNCNYKVNKLWNTPVVSKFKVKDCETVVVIYPEVVFGNPLNVTNVVRWFLHQPGHISKQINYGLNELHYKFNSAVKDFNYCYSTLSKQELKVIYYPLEYYNYENVQSRTDTCHAIRKGEGKPVYHEMDSILIDGKSHKEVAAIFKKSKLFISYDEYTAYSLFAVLCGCESIVVPSEGIQKDDWYPNPTDRYGIAYGFSELEKKLAEETRHKVLEHIIAEHKASMINVENFVRETKSHFLSIKKF